MLISFNSLLGILKDNTETLILGTAVLPKWRIVSFREEGVCGRTIQNNNLIFSIRAMNFTLFLTAVLTGLGFVGLVTVLAKLLAPRSYNSQKEDPFECGIPTRGRTWMQFRVGYYLFAILFLMFDVETMFLFPWAVVMKSLGAAALASIVFFLFILVLGLAYAWKKGALEWQ